MRIVFVRANFEQDLSPLILVYPCLACVFHILNLAAVLQLNRGGMPCLKPTLLFSENASEK